MRGWKHEEARGWNSGEMIHNAMWIITDKQYGWKINLFISERCPLSHAPLGRYENDDASDSPLKRGVIWFHRRNKRKTIWCNLAPSRAGQLLVRVHTCDVWVMERAALNAALSWIISPASYFSTHSAAVKSGFAWGGFILHMILYDLFMCGKSSHGGTEHLGSCQGSLR